MTSLKLFLNSSEIEVGVDEAGRGCLMGRVYAAAVILPATFPDDVYLQIKDSKKLSEKKRNLLKTYIETHALSYGVGFAEIDEIDKVNIYNATILAMHRALDKIDISVDRILVDGDRFKPYYDTNGNYPSYTCIKKGDDTIMSIAAASILAKCYRDAYVKEIVNQDNKYAIYGWLTNKGYGTSVHINMIKDKGISKYHRLTFAPCNGVSLRFT